MDGAAPRGQPGEIELRIVPIYLPGSSVPRLEWVNGPQAPRDWCAFASDTYLPRAWDVDVGSAESVEKWRRASDAYIEELEELQAEWLRYEEAVEAGRRSLTAAQLVEHPDVLNLFGDDEIVENSETLAVFAEMMLEEIDDVEEAVEQAKEDDE